MMIFNKTPNDYSLSEVKNNVSSFVLRCSLFKLVSVVLDYRTGQYSSCDNTTERTIYLITIIIFYF